MSTTPKSPSSMTKERLIEELKKNNIPLPRSRARKDVYVELYQRRLLDNDPQGDATDSSPYATYRHMAMNTSPKFGFSSDEDEEEIVRFKKAAVLNLNNSNRKRASKKAKRVEFEDHLADIERLSDTELRRELGSWGVRPGPIVATTRAVYERKLANLLLQQAEGENDERGEEEGGVSQEEEEAEGQSQENEYSDSDVDDGSETQAASRTVSSRMTRSQASRVIEQESSSQTRQRSGILKPAATSSTETKSKTAKPKTKPYVPVWLQILIFLIVAAILILIWYSMETTAPGKYQVT